MATLGTYRTDGSRGGGRSSGGGLPPARRVSEDYFGGLVEVAESDGVCYVRVTGNGTLLTGTPLSKYLREKQLDGVKEFVFDLSACTGMDSSFMGLLTGVAMDSAETPGGMALFMGIGDYPRRQLLELGVFEFFTEGVVNVPPDLEWRKLEPDSVSKLDRVRLAHSAHERLVRANPKKNRSRFIKLLKRLGAELFPFLSSRNEEASPAPDDEDAERPRGSGGD